MDEKLMKLVEDYLMRIYEYEIEGKEKMKSVLYGFIAKLYEAGLLRF